MRHEILIRMSHSMTQYDQRWHHKAKKCFFINFSGEANEAKRTTDGYADLAQIFHEIEDCPAILFNARRKLIMEVKGVIVGNCSTLKVGDKITLFIFKDCVEIAKVSDILYI